MITKQRVLLIIWFISQKVDSSNHTAVGLDSSLQMNHLVYKRAAHPVFIIECLQNCPPLVPVCNVHQEVIIEAACTANCDGVAQQNFLWTVNDADFNYDTGADQMGRDMNIFLINADTLKVGKTYHVEVIFKGDSNTKASTLLITHEAPKLLSAKITPNTGDALKTKFVLECSPENGPYVFEIYALSGESEFLLQRGKKCSEMPVYLSSETKMVKVKMIDEYQYSDSKNLEVTVNAVLGPVSTEQDLVKELQEQYFDPSSPNSISKLIEDKNYDQLLQVLNVLSDDLEKLSGNVDTADTVKRYEIEVLSILSQAPMESKERARQAASIAGKISKSYKLKSDPDVAKAASKICEKAAVKNLEFLEKEAYPKSLEAEIQEDSKLFAECSQAGTAPNMEILEEDDTVSEPTTPFPLMEIPTIVEDYPDYVDDQNISRILLKYEDSSNSLVTLCYLSSRTLALSMSVQDIHRSVIHQAFEVTATKTHGVDVPSVPVSSQNVKVSASEDFVKFGKKEVEVLVVFFVKKAHS